MATIKHLSDGGPDGNVFGQSITDKIAFYGNAPVTQPAVLASVTTTASVSVIGGVAFATSQQAQLTIAAINTVISQLKTLGLMATA